MLFLFSVRGAKASFQLNLPTSRQLCTYFHTASIFLLHRDCPLWLRYWRDNVLCICFYSRGLSSHFYVKIASIKNSTHSHHILCLWCIVNGANLQNSFLAINTDNGVCCTLCFHLRLHLNVSLFVFLSSLVASLHCLLKLYVSTDPGEKTCLGTYLGLKGKFFMLQFLSPVTEFPTVAKRLHAFAYMPPKTTFFGIFSRFLRW